MGGKIYLYGGRDPCDDISNQIFMFDCEKETLIEMKGESYDKVPYLCKHGCTVFNESMYVYGGYGT